MKKLKFTSALLLIIIVLFGCKNSVETEKQANKQIDKQNCLADDCLLVEDLTYPAGALPAGVIDALDLAIEDEYKAKSTYDKVIAGFGNVRPFIMIVRAEETHISSLLSIYDKYGLQAPENDWADKIIAPQTLQQACAIGVEAEIENARLYQEDLIPLVQEFPDIESAFNNLMEASRTKHLPAFQKCD